MLSSLWRILDSEYLSWRESKRSRSPSPGHGDSRENLAAQSEIKQLPELDRRLARMEQIFHSPPLTPELIAAIKLISPLFDLAPKKAHRKFWEADQNGACWGEYEALEPYLSDINTDTLKILEIGPGLGRSLVFFAKKLGWRGNQQIHFARPAL
jgi:hypothetical protein